MITIGEKIILGLTALFLSGLCVFAVMGDQGTVLSTQTADMATTIDPTVALSQEEIVEETTPINLNTATVEELDELPGIGETLAQRIWDYRAEHGAFATVDDIMLVPGIGEATLEDIRIYTVVE